VAAPLRPIAALLLLAAAGCAGSPRGGAPATRPDGLPARVRIAVTGAPQRRSLSCESRSSCDLLGWSDRRVSEDVFQAGLPRSDNPDRGFVGDVDGPGGNLPPAGYGVHAMPVADRLEAHGLEARAVRGVDRAWLEATLATGRPVIVWATAHLDAPEPARRVDAGGVAFVCVPGEHTFLAVGYEPGAVLLLDPATASVRRVPWARFDSSWATLGRMALEPLSGPAPRRGP